LLDGHSRLAADDRVVRILLDSPSTRGTELSIFMPDDDRRPCSVQTGAGLKPILGEPVGLLRRREGAPGALRTHIGAGQRKDDVSTAMPTPGRIHTERERLHTGSPHQLPAYTLSDC